MLSILEDLKLSSPLATPVSYPCLQWYHMLRPQGKKARCIHLLLSASFSLSLFPDLSVFVLPPAPNPSTAPHTPHTHPCLSFCLCSVFSLYLCLSVCWSACLSCLLEPFTVPSSFRDRVCFLWAGARPWREECFENSTWTPHQTTLQLCLASGHQFVHLI